MAVRRRFADWTMGKAGRLAQVVHRAANAHAQANQHIRLRTPETIVELARAMGNMADQARYYYRAAIRDAMDAGDYASRANLEELAAEMDDISADYQRAIREFGDELVRQTYSISKAATLMDLADRGVDVPQDPVEQLDWGVSFTQVDRAAMAAIANDMFSDLAGKTNRMAEGAVRVLRTTAGGILTHELMMGHTPTAAAQALEDALTAKGFSQSMQMRKLNEAMLRSPSGPTGRGPILKSTIEAARMLNDDGLLTFVDAGGKHWDLREYCQMAARTKLSIAKNEAAIATMADAEVNHWTTNWTGDDCRICGRYEGKVWWTGAGDAAGHDRTSAFPPFHPNCLHYVIPYVLEANQASDQIAGAD